MPACTNFANQIDLVCTSICQLFLILFYITSSIAKGFYRNLTPFNWQKKKSLDEKLVLITGAGGGIGRELAKHFAALGSRLVLWDANQQANEKTAEECRLLGAEVTAHVIDITNRAAVYNLAAEVGPVDVLVNNAGLLNNSRFLDTSDQLTEQLLAVNTMALFWTTKAFLPAMLERKTGHLVCISSVAGLVGAPGLVDYSTSKFAAFGFMEALEHEFWDQPTIHFTTVCPTFVKTPMIQDLKINYQHLYPLQSEYVARRVVEAVQTNQRVLIIPAKIYWAYAAKGILPWNLYQTILFRRAAKYS